MTTLKITRTVRAAITEIVRNSKNYDVATMRIDRSGAVMARIDPNKTGTGHDSTWEALVGHVENMVTPDGIPLEGY